MSKLDRTTCRWKWIALWIGTLLTATEVHATIITLSSDHVNAIIGPGAGPSYPDTTYDNNNNFTTHGFGPQRTLVLLSNASLLSALQTALGPGPYQINSATLTVGSDADDYAPGVAVNAARVLVSYDPTQVTWNSRSTGTPWASPGLQPGTEFTITPVSTSTPTFGHTTTERDFTGLAPVLQSWLDTTTPNYGLLFGAVSIEALSSDFTDYHNVVWTLDAVPEPSSVLLIASGGLLLWRRRGSLEHGA